MGFWWLVPHVFSQKADWLRHFSFKLVFVPHRPYTWSLHEINVDKWRFCVFSEKVLNSWIKGISLQKLLKFVIFGFPEVPRLPEGTYKPIFFRFCCPLPYRSADLGTVAEDGESIWGHRKQREEFSGCHVLFVFLGENAIEKIKINKYMSCIQQGVKY